MERNTATHTESAAFPSLEMLLWRKISVIVMKTRLATLWRLVKAVIFWLAGSVQRGSLHDGNALLTQSRWVLSMRPESWGAVGVRRREGGWRSPPYHRVWRAEGAVLPPAAGRQDIQSPQYGGPAPQHPLVSTRHALPWGQAGHSDTHGERRCRQRGALDITPVLGYVNRN